jgi:predicted transport protein
MPIYQNRKGGLNLIKEVKIAYEKDLQELTENNLSNIFGLKFISSEFILGNFRLDTLAFDEDTKSFVIIEYKRDKSFSVIDQGFSYLSLMLNNKADFILEYNEKNNDNLQRGSIDWSQSRVLFLANSFTDHQKNSINFKDLPIELWEVKKYENDTILYNPIKASKATESINKISNNSEIKNVSKEVKKYATDDHFKDNWKSKEIFEILRERIFEIDGQIKEGATKTYIGYKIGKDVLFDLNIRKDKIEVHLYRTKPVNVKDSQKIVSYIENSMKYWNKHVSKFHINSIDDIDYSIYLMKQVYNIYQNKK